MAARRKPEDSRTRLIAAATAVLGEHGWIGASSRRIAASAGLNLSLISYYFGSLDGLLLAVVRDATQHLVDHTANCFHAGDLVALAETALRLVDDPQVRPALRVLTEASIQASRDADLAVEIQRYLLDFRASLYHPIARALGSAAKPDVITAAAELLAATLDGLLLHRAIGLEFKLAPLWATLLRMHADR
jgi:AcrR family transcriptional regulator